MGTRSMLLAGLTHMDTAVLFKHQCILSWTWWRLNLSFLPFLQSTYLNKIPPVDLNLLASGIEEQLRDF